MLKDCRKQFWAFKPGVQTTLTAGQSKVKVQLRKIIYLAEPLGIRFFIAPSLRLKKGKDLRSCFLHYGFFLSMSMPTMAIAMIIAMAATAV